MSYNWIINEKDKDVRLEELKNANIVCPSGDFVIYVLEEQTFYVREDQILIFVDYKTIGNYYMPIVNSIYGTLPQDMNEIDI
jgi:hypothetical protein